jgi:hypothetical protein
MLTIEALVNKGFNRTVYEDQTGKPVFYTREFNELSDVKRLHKYLGESIGEFDFDYDGLRCVVEIVEDLSEGQYLFTEKKIEFGYSTHDRLSTEDFQQLLDIL